MLCGVMRPHTLPSRLSRITPRVFTRSKNDQRLDHPSLCQIRFWPSQPRGGEGPEVALKRPSIGRADRRLAGVKLALPNGRRTAAVDPSKARGRCGRSPSTPIRPSPFLRRSSALRRDHFVMPGRDALHPIAGTDMLDAQRRRTGPYWRVRPGMWQMGYSVNNNARFWRGDGLPEREQ